MRNGVKGALKRRNILNGRELTHNVRQNLRMITILEFLGLFDARDRMHYVLHAKSSEMGVWTSKYLKRERNKALFSSKSSNDYDFRVSERLLTLENVCSTFCVRSKVKRAFKRWNILNGREITHNFRQNRRVITISEFLCLFWCWKTNALRYACEMDWNGRLNVEIS